MDDTPPPVSPATLKFLARLVTVLTATMIVGVVVIVALLVIRFSGEERTPPLALPESIDLPGEARATAVTLGDDWLAVVTEDDRILIYDRVSGSLRQTVDIERQN
ncbi:DUF6476 family protein [uncultured Roseovarius sp.]|uniref:DUF6476 family protein n=1 Tax=uncultured Roseovarius sp. TaxID=293344 RepID=UPI002605F5B7|nr:DUF6476 family protein [uncultured Roseovarius sp.]